MSTTTILIDGLLLANILWFGAGFWYFTFKSAPATYGLVASGEATERGRSGTGAALRFLGGLNLALAASATITLVRIGDFPAALLPMPFATFCIAHASQFAVNLPSATREARGLPTDWPVLRGLMRTIFVVDGALMVLTAVAAVALSA